MQLSQSGRVVLIDDIFKEIKPLMEALGKCHIPYLYYDGSHDDLPIHPPNGIRFVFLDIELSGMKGQSEKTKASGLVARLKKIISNENGPYVIIFWTAHNEVIQQVLENCKSASISPVSWLNLEKSDNLGPDGSYDIQKITTALELKLSSIGAFQLYVEWENILDTSSKQFILEFSSLVNPEEDWSGGTSSLFYELYKAYVEKNELDNQNKQFRCACHLMNRSFLDTLESKTNAELSLPSNFRITKGNLTDDSKAKINTSLFINNNRFAHPVTGCVFFEDDKNILNGLKTYLFKTNKIPDEIKLCKIIITPECDLAQNKVITIPRTDDSNSTLHRIVYGLFYPMSVNTSEEMKNLRDRGKDARYIIGPLWYVDKRWLLVINFSTLAIKEEICFNDEALFSLKRDLLFDLQSNAANHVNRLGNFQLK